MSSLRTTRSELLMRVFLSGPIDGTPIADAASWRAKATRGFEARGIGTYDPTRVITSTPGYVPRPHEVFANDRYHLQRCDVVLVNLDLPETVRSQDAPFFTIGEMFLAHDADLPVITVGSTFRGRPGYEAIVTRSFDTLDDAVDYIIDTYEDGTS
jgi:hypothetical protein